MTISKSHKTTAEGNTLRHLPGTACDFFNTQDQESCVVRILLGLFCPFKFTLSQLHQVKDNQVNSNLIFYSLFNSTRITTFGLESSS